MEVKAFRAASIQDAVQLVRSELGPDASLLEARAVNESTSAEPRQVEVLASKHVRVPSRFDTTASPSEWVATYSQADAYRQSLALQTDHGASVVERLSQASDGYETTEGFTRK